MGVTKDEIVRDEIIKEAQKLFQQYGWKKTTMDEIAEACGKAKSTLYHYFKNKEDVFQGVIDFELRNLRIIVKASVEKANTMQDKIMTYFLEFHREILGMLNLYRLLRREIKDEKIAQMQFKRFMNFEKSYMARLLSDGYDIGEFRHTDELDIPMFAEILLAAFLGIVQYSIEAEQGLDQEKLELIARNFIPQIFK